ncbi:Alpha/Beta hydrolase protein [Geopyxis carbonaria]|nr:Alpha/Beta hydrolase protein [Geopyxis carbonaria]
MTSSSETPYEHSTPHGKITGILTTELDTPLVQFRSLPYATVSHRFAAPTVLPLTARSATTWGPIAPQPSNAEEMDAHILNTPLHAVPASRKRPDELGCTNLTIVMPRDLRGAVPVLLWAHGGAYKLGSANYAASSLLRVVAHSVRMGRPVVGVGLNRRLNSLGMGCSTSVDGVDGNSLLRDERAALEWVQRYVGAFGGDAEQVCWWGSSAGSCSGGLHLLAEKAQFRRAILLSGMPGLLPARPREAQEKCWGELCEKLGVPGEAVKTLEAAKVAEVAFDVQTVPTRDDDVVPGEGWLRHEGYRPKPKWCTEVLVGMCSDEWAVMALAGGVEKYARPARVVHERLRAAGVKEAETLLDAFGVRDDAERDAQVTAVYKMLAEYGFRQPAAAFAKRWAREHGTAYLCETRVGSPLAGPNTGRAHHGVDVVLSMMNFADDLPAEGGYRELGERMAEAWIRFAYGEAPWGGYGKETEGRMKVWNTGEGETEGAVRDMVGDECVHRWELMEREGIDRVWEVLQLFLEKGPQGDEEKSKE